MLFNPETRVLQQGGSLPSRVTLRPDEAVEDVLVPTPISTPNGALKEAELRYGWSTEHWFELACFTPEGFENDRKLAFPRGSVLFGSVKICTITGNSLRGKGYSVDDMHRTVRKPDLTVRRDGVFDEQLQESLSHIAIGSLFEDGQQLLLPRVTSIGKTRKVTEDVVAYRGLALLPATQSRRSIYGMPMFVRTWAEADLIGEGHRLLGVGVLLGADSLADAVPLGTPCPNVFTGNPNRLWQELVALGQL